MKTMKKWGAILMAASMALSVVGVMPVKESKAFVLVQSFVEKDGIIYDFVTDEEDPNFETAYVRGTTDDFKTKVKLVTTEDEISTGSYAPGEVAVIPKSIEHEGHTFKVTAIGSDTTPAFSESGVLEIVHVPAYITTIADRAFADCPELREVILPEGIKEIKEQTFVDDARLTDVDLPESLESIGALAFDGCLLLNDIEIPKNVTNIAGMIGDENPAFSEDAPINMYGYIGSVAETYADSQSNVTFVPVNGIANDYFRLKFPDSWVGKYHTDILDDGSGVAVHSKKCYEEDKGGGWLFTVFVDANGGYKEIPGYSVLKKDGGMVYLVTYPTAVQIDLPGEVIYGYSDEANAEYTELMQTKPEDPSAFKVLVEAPGKAVIKSVKNVKGKKAKITLKKKVKGATMYDFEYATKKNFSNPTAETGKKLNLTTSVKLKKGKTYYVRARAIKTSGNAVVYGAWSAVKKVKIKK